LLIGGMIDRCRRTRCVGESGMVIMRGFPAGFGA
jgi:hypothetical protein